jgi:16S rRNA (guanine527-N7)-methyltransferase
VTVPTTAGTEVEDVAAGGTPAGGPPPAPETAREVFGERLPLLEAYCALLAGPAVERGLIGPREAPRLWERHLLNCVAVGDLVDEGATVLDLGSGAGLPGLVLACARPDLTVVLAEPLLRRATFLSEAVESLGLRTVLVRRARAEELARSVEVDAVTARAVAPLDRLVGWALPLLRPGGRLLALKGSSAADELAAAGPALHRAGAVSSELVEVGSPDLGTAATVVVVERGNAARPRSAGPKGAPATGPSRTSASARTKRPR